MPLIISNKTIHPFVVPKAFFLFAVVEITIVLLLWLLSRHPQWKPRHSWISIAFYCFVGTQLIASLLSIDPSISFWSEPPRMNGFFQLLHITLAYFAMTCVLRSKKDWVMFLTYSISVAVILCVLHIVSLLGVDILEGARAGSTTGNSTYFGAYLILQVAFACYVFIASQIKWLKWYASGICVLSVVTLFATDARAAQVSLIGGIIFALALFLITQKRKVLKAVGISLVAGLTLVFAAVVVFIFVPGSILQNLFISFATESRLVVWDIAWQAIKDKPIFGWGPETFVYAFLEHYIPCFGSDACGTGFWFDRAHNVIIDTMVGSGIVGLFAYLSTFVVTIVFLWKTFFAKRISSYSPIILTAMLVAYFIQNLTGFDSLVSWFCWVVSLALAHSIVTHGKTQAHHRRLIIAVPIFATVLLPLFIFYFVILPREGCNSAFSSRNATNIEGHLSEYKIAVTVSPAGLDYRRVSLANVTNDYLRSHSVEMLLGNSVSVRQEIALVEEALLDTIDTTPNYLRAYLHLGRLYQIEGRLFDPSAFQKSERVLLSAIEKNPRNQTSYWILSSVLSEQGRVAEAFDLTQTALDFDTRVYKAHIARAAAAKFTGDKELLDRVARESIEMHPKLSGIITTIVQSDINVQRDLLLNVFE
jgi:O-antigen ligase